MTPGKGPLDTSQLIAHLSVDCVIFSLKEGKLSVLVLHISGVNGWTLPGGHVRKDRSVDQCARDILEMRTGLKNIYLRQFQVFGGADRSFPDAVQKLAAGFDIEKDVQAFLSQRSVSIGYYALIDYAKFEVTGGDFHEEYQWAPVDKLPRLLMDHKQIISVAREALKKDLSYDPIGYNLLPEKFTMPELQRMYEAIMDEKYERSHFQKKMIKSGLYERLEEKREGVAHKRPYLYRFRG